MTLPYVRLIWRGDTSGAVEIIWGHRLTHFECTGQSWWSPLCPLFVSFGIQIGWREAKIIGGHRPTPFECTGQSMRDTTGRDYTGKDNWGSQTNTIWMLVNLRNDRSVCLSHLREMGHSWALIKGQTKVICLSLAWLVVQKNVFLPNAGFSWNPGFFSSSDGHNFSLFSPTMIVIPGS